MATLKRLIEIVVDARGAQTGATAAGSALNKVGQSAKVARNELSLLQGGLNNVSTALQYLTKVTVAGLGISAISRYVKQVVRDTAAFEVALAELGKSADIAGQPLEDLGQVFVRLARVLPGSAVDLVNVGAAAAKLGIEGAKNLEQFTGAIARFQAASLNEIGVDQATDMFARLQNITAEPASKIDELTGAVLLLGRTTAATNREVLDFGIDIARATASFGVSSKQAAAMGAAMASVGGEAASSSTSILKAFRTITDGARNGGRELELLETIMAMTGEQIQKSFKENATSTFARFIQGLSAIQRKGVDVLPVLEDLGLGEVRVARGLLPLITNYELFQKTIDRVNDSSRNAREGYALTARGLDTINAKYERLSDTLAEVRRNIGNTERQNIKSFLTTLAEASALLFGLEGAEQEASESAKTLAQYLKLAAAALGLIAISKAPVVIGLFIASAKLLYGFLATKLNPTLASTSVLMGRLALSAAVFFAAFNLGTTIYDQFKGVQIAAAKFVNQIMNGWESIKLGVKEAGLVIEFVFNKAFDSLRKPLGEWLADFAGGLRTMNEFMGATSFPLAEKLEAMSAKILKTQANQSKSLVTLIADATREGTEKQNFNDQVLAKTLKDIETEFAKNGAKSSESFWDAFIGKMSSKVDQVTAIVSKSFAKIDPAAGSSPHLEIAGNFQELADSLKTQVDTTGIEKLNVDFEKLNYLLKQNSAGAQEALQSVRHYIEVLNLESDLIGKTQDERYIDRRIERADIEHKLMKQSLGDLKDLQSLLAGGPIEIDIDPEKARVASEILDTIAKKTQLLRDQRQFEGFAESFGNAFGDAATKAVFAFKSIEDSAEALIRNVSELIFQQLVSRQIAMFFSNLALGSPGLFGGPSAKGNVFNSGSMIPYADGGVVNRPTLFPMSGGRTGLMGEQGPESIMPLGRTSTGELGVKTTGSSGGRSTVVNMYISTPDSDSFRRSETMIHRRLSSSFRR